MTTSARARPRLALAAGGGDGGDGAGPPRAVIELLQLSRLELLAEIRKELEVDPVLAEEDP